MCTYIYIYIYIYMYVCGSQWQGSHRVQRPGGLPPSITGAPKTSGGVQFARTASGLGGWVSKQGTQGSKHHPREGGDGGEGEGERGRGESKREAERGREGGRGEGVGGGNGPQQVSQDAANRATARQVDAQPNGPESTPWD